jgi:hypothetical protein
MGLSVSGTIWYLRHLLMFLLVLQLRLVSHGSGQHLAVVVEFWVYIGLLIKSWLGLD